MKKLLEDLIGTTIACLAGSFICILLCLGTVGAFKAMLKLLSM